jgi:hypothetical protein
MEVRERPIAATWVVRRQVHMLKRRPITPSTVNANMYLNQAVTPIAAEPHKVSTHGQCRVCIED